AGFVVAALDEVVQLHRQQRLPHDSLDVLDDHRALGDDGKGQCRGHGQQPERDAATQAVWRAKRTHRWDGPFDVKLIQTLPRVGYRLARVATQDPNADR